MSAFEAFPGRRPGGQHQNKTEERGARHPHRARHFSVVAPGATLASTATSA
jgi:hypothetical protein